MIFANIDRINETINELLFTKTSLESYKESLIEQIMGLDCADELFSGLQYSKTFVLTVVKRESYISIQKIIHNIFRGNVFIKECRDNKEVFKKLI